MAYGTSSTASTNSSTVTVTTPASTAAGDTLIFAIAGDSSTATVTAWPTGFTPIAALLRNPAASPDGHFLHAAIKVADGTEGGSLVATLSASIDFHATVLRYTGRHTVTPLDSATPISTINTSSAPSPTITSATFTPSMNNCDVVMIATPDVTASTTQSFAPPGGWTERVDDSITGWVNLTVIDSTQTTATATGSVSITTTLGANAGYSAYLFALAPNVVLEQEGYRFRNDDGSETTATWLASQDTDVSQALATNTRLRVLVNATGDPASTQYQLEYKKTSDSEWIPVPTSSALTTAFGSLGTAPAVTGTSSVSVAYPTDIEVGDLLITPIVSRLGSTAIDTESGWSATSNNSANVATSEGSAGAEAADGGGVRVTVFYRIADGTETGTVAFANTGTATLSKFGRMLRYTKPAWATWDLAACNGKDATSGVTAYSALMGSDPGINAGDILIAATVGNTDSPTWSAETITGPGITTSLTSERFDTAVTGGNDTRLVVSEHAVSAGPSSGAPTFGATMSTVQPEGATVITRIRATGTPPFIMTASGNITASGQATTAQLTAPSGKSTSDFVAGRMQDDENPADAVNITTDDYTELEWCFQADAGLTTSDVYEFRVTAAGTALDTYSVTPQWTIPGGGGSQSVTGVSISATALFSGTVAPQAVTVVGGTINATQLFAGTTRYNVTGSSISATQLFAGTVTPQAVTVIGAAIAATQLFSGTVVPQAVTISGASISGTQLFAGSTTYVISGATLSGTQLFSGTVTVGAVTVVGDTLATTQLFPGTVSQGGGGSQAVTGDTLATTALFSGTVTVGSVAVVGASISGSQLFSGTVVPQAVGVTGSSVSATQLFTGTVTAGQLVVGEHLNLTQLFSGTVTTGAVQITGGHISGTVLYSGIVYFDGATFTAVPTRLRMRFILDNMEIS